MTITAFNAPLAALFGLAYGMGHPACAPYRPAVVDKTLASFHDDVNRSIRDFNEGAQRIVLARATLNAAAAGQPQGASRMDMPSRMVTEIPTRAHGKAALGIVEHTPVKLVEIPRKPGGFTELKAR